MTHTTFQELLLTPFKVHEILWFEILSSEKHFYHWEISEILLRIRGLVARSGYLPRAPAARHLQYARVLYGLYGLLSKQNLIFFHFSQLSQSNALGSVKANPVGWAGSTRIFEDLWSKFVFFEYAAFSFYRNVEESQI